MRVSLETGWYRIVNVEWFNFAAMHDSDSHNGGATICAEADDESEGLKVRVDKVGIDHPISDIRVVVVY